jgi:cyclic beta-1,2-glucan synthetase
MTAFRPLRASSRSARGAVPSSDGLDEPIVAELFSGERLEQHASSLAAAQSVTRDPRRGRALRPSVIANGRGLLAS